MTNIGWHFGILDGGNEQGYINNGIEAFKGKDLIDNLAREVCQNSLDAQLNFQEPVHIVFDLKSIPLSEYDLFSELGEHLESCRKYRGSNIDEKTHYFLEGAEKTLSSDSIPILIISDYNTKGLTGIQDAPFSDRKSVWRALVHSDGTSEKDGNNAGGSYGIGKNAPFACSSLSCVFYNTLAIDKQSAFQGVARIGTHYNKKNEATQGTGHYYLVDDRKPILDNCSFKNLFPRNEFGTDVIVLGFNQSNWQKKVEIAIMKNFFLAIHENKLKVTIGNSIISSQTIKEKLYGQYATDLRLKATRELYAAVIDPEFPVFRERIFEESENYDVELYLKSDSSYSQHIVGFRSTGMLIKSYPRQQIMRPFAAVLVVRGDQLSELLRRSEPPKHDTWDYTLVHEQFMEKTKRAIKDIRDWIKKIISEQYKSSSDKKLDSGVGRYLPAFGDNSPDSDLNVELLKANQSIFEITKTKSPQKYEVLAGNEDSGNENTGNVYGSRNNDQKTYLVPPFVLPSDDTQIKGVSPQKGDKKIITPNITGLKTIPLDAINGLYRVILISKDNNSNIYISFNSVGEDGKKEAIKINYYIDNGIQKTVQKSKIGPLEIEKNIPKIIEVNIQSSEKLYLKTIISGDS